LSTIKRDLVGKTLVEISENDDDDDDDDDENCNVDTVNDGEDG